jgi:hypothetical protein
VGEPNARPCVGQDDQGRHFYSLVGQDIPVLSDRTIGWLLGPGDGTYRLDPEFREQLDTPMQGLLTTLKPLAEALRSVQAVIISTVSEKGKQRLDRVAPQFHPLAELGGAFRKDIIRAFAARFRGFAHHDTPVTVAGQSLRAYAAAHAAAANSTTGDRYPIARFVRARGTNRLAALTAIVGEDNALTPGLFPLEPPPRITAEEHPCLRPGELDADSDDDAPVSPRLLAMEVEDLRELTAALLDEAGTSRIHSEGAFTAVTARLARIELRAPGGEQLATVDDIHMYAEATARRVDAFAATLRKAEARLRALEATLRVVAMHAASGEPFGSRNPEIRSATERAIRAVQAMLASPEPGHDPGPAPEPGSTPPAYEPDSDGSAARDA